MDTRHIFKTMDAQTYLATDEAAFRLVLDDPRYLAPPLSALHVLRFRLLFDCWHDTGGGNSQILGVYEVIGTDRSTYMVRHATLDRGAFGAFDLIGGATVRDKELSKKAYKAIEREYVDMALPAIRDGSEEVTNTNYVEVMWMFNRTHRQAGWCVPNSTLSGFENQLRKLADALVRGELA